MRRDPEAILTAHRMDRSRREVYVEGSRDRLFLGWLLDEEKNPDASVHEIASVDLPDIHLGGERARLLHFGRWLGDKEANIRCFADADWDRVLGRGVPPAVWLTDYHDLEGYVLRIECVDKVLRLGVATSRVAASVLLGSVREQGRQLGLVRLMSELDSLSLPFHSTRLRRYVASDGGQVSVDLHGYLQTLLQKADISLAQLQTTCARLAEVEGTYRLMADEELIHGKDAMCLMAVALSDCGVRHEDASGLLWTSFESSFVEAGSMLGSVRDFLRA